MPEAGLGGLDIHPQSDHLRSGDEATLCSRQRPSSRVSEKHNGTVLIGGPGALAQARRQLSRLDQILLSPEVLDRAATLAPHIQLRSLDAIHLAAAQVVGADLRAVVTYDRRMADAAHDLGLTVEAPV